MNEQVIKGFKSLRVHTLNTDSSEISLERSALFSPRFIQIIKCSRVCGKPVH